MRKSSVVRKSIISIGFLFITNCSMAQSNDDSGIARALYDTIYLMDSIFLKHLIHAILLRQNHYLRKNLEFYHDAGGLTNYVQNLESIRYRCNTKTKVRRELVKESLEVYPIKNYGAIEIGRHRFYYTAVGKEEKLEGTFRFIHIWIHKTNEWQISR
jgi:hypothetical protein